MMQYLVDTHTFLWFIEGSPALSKRAKDLLESDVNLLLSIASLWEISIKISIGKIALTQPFELFIPDQLTKNAIEILPITTEHLVLLTSLPFHHRDPFDRLLIAQVIHEQLSIVSKDSHFDPYGIQKIW